MNYMIIRNVLTGNCEIKYRRLALIYIYKTQTMTYVETKLMHIKY